MIRPSRIQTGIERLLARPAALRGKRVGLLSHPASVDARGIHSSTRLHQLLGRRLTALYGPEHGFFGGATAGENVVDARHPAWNIPVYSLYGAFRKPSAEMLADIDVLVIDLQDLAIRCYTFISTLWLAMEACAEQDKAVVVCDRPVPFPDRLDGPQLNPAFASFVAQVPVPLVYGLTQAEAASLLRKTHRLDLDLSFQPMRGYQRKAARPAMGAPWISPSPGIRLWETAWTYPATVWCEALPALQCGRGGLSPFQLVTAPWIEPGKLIRRLERLKLPGVDFSPHWDPAPGIRLVVTKPDSFAPVATGIAMLSTLQKMYGADRIWNQPGTRPEWFDKLMGTDAVRLALLAGADGREISAGWEPGLAAFRALRKEHLIYPK